MKINFENKNELNKLYIHDSEFFGYCYNYSKRQISFLCDDLYYRKRTQLIFSNVILSNLQSCSFWHSGSSILYVNLEENPSQLQELMEIQKEKQDIYEGSYLDRGIKYLPIVFQLNSGDTLLIICETMEWTEEFY